MHQSKDVVVADVAIHRWLQWLQSFFLRQEQPMKTFRNVDRAAVNDVKYADSDCQTTHGKEEGSSNNTDWALQHNLSVDGEL